ncbi:MAG: manganese efflux pump MntP family protein [Fastidiosipilaceae bacterium]
MDTISIILIAFALAMDASAVSLCNGMQIEKLQVRHMLRFGSVFGFFQGMMTLIGFLIGTGFRDMIQSIDHWLAFAILGVIGGKMIYEFTRGGSCATGANNNGLNSHKTMLILALATSIDALAVGISFSVIHVNLWLAVWIIAAVTFLCSFFSVWIGRKAGSMLGKWAELAGGILLIGIGARILVEHLMRGI